MKINKNLLFYVLIITVFGSLMYWIGGQGKTLESSRVEAIQQPTVNSGDAFTQFFESFSHNLSHPLATLVLQIIAIIAVSRIFGYIFNKMGQPTVIGEIIAGITLGPSLLGAGASVLPSWQFAVAP